MSHPQPSYPQPSYPAEAPPVEVQRPAPSAIAAVRASCAAVADRPVRLAESFYAHLFEMAPQLRAMFAPDLTGQMQKMTDALLGAIAHLATTDTAELEVALRRLGADHHTRLHVEPEHYLYVGHALTRAVRDVSGPEYSGSVSSSWIAVCQWVAAHMIAGAEAAEARASTADRMAEQAPVAVPQPRGPQQAGSRRVPRPYRRRWRART